MSILAKSFSTLLFLVAVKAEQEPPDSLDPTCFSESIFGSSLSYEEPLDVNWRDGECKSGTLQSPIDIPRSGNTLVDFEDMDYLDYYSSPAYMRLANTGHSVMMDIGKCHPLYEFFDRMPRITGGGLNGTYVFHQLHLHWGSEHYKSGTQFPLEAQLIHFNEIYGSMENATDAPDGIAILVTLFQMAADLNPKLDYFLNYLPNITAPGSATLVETPFPLDYFLPRNKRMFYRYHGSLTAPPCHENVIWTVFKLPVMITLKQLDDLRFINTRNRKAKSTVLGENVRPLQPRNGRPIYENLSNNGSVFYQCIYFTITFSALQFLLFTD